MTVQELIERIKDYPCDAKIDVDMIPYTLYQSYGTSNYIKGLTTNYDKDKHILNLWLKR